MSASKTQSLARTPDHAIIAPAETPKTAIPVFPALAKVDPQLAVDAKSQLENDKERLAQISRENGALGGRPPINTVELTQYCLDTEFSYHGQYTLRHYKSKWYLLKDGCYRTIPEEDIDAKVTGCLIRAGIEWNDPGVSVRGGPARHGKDHGIRRGAPRELLSRARDRGISR